MSREKLKLISERAVYLYFDGMGAKEAIAKAKEIIENNFRKDDMHVRKTGNSILQQY